MQRPFPERKWKHRLRWKSSPSSLVFLVVLSTGELVSWKVIRLQQAGKSYLRFSWDPVPGKAVRANCPQDILSAGWEHGTALIQFHALAHTSERLWRFST
jgi:hypothetical protein